MPLDLQEYACQDLHASVDKTSRMVDQKAIHPTALYLIIADSTFKVVSR